MTLIIWLLFGVGLPVVLLTYLYYMRSKVVVIVPAQTPQESLADGSDGILANWARREGVNADLIWVIAYTVISVVVYALLWERNLFDTNLSYVTWPLVIALQIGIAARLSRVFVPIPWNRYGFHLLNGTAIVYLVYVILGNPEDIAYILSDWFGGGSASTASAILENTENIARSRLYITLAILAITIYKALPFIHEENGRWNKWKDAILAICLGLIAYGLFTVLDSFSPGLSGMTAVGWVVFAGVLAMALGTVARYGRNIQDALISEVSIWISSSNTRMFVIGVAISAYVMFLRPYLYGLAQWSTSLIEWAAFCFVVWRLYDGIRGRISDTYSVQLKYTSWKKHMQQIQKQVDSDFSYATNVQADFIERSHKDQLLVFLVTLMHDNGMSVEEISQVLHPLAEYKDEVIPIFSFTKARNLIRSGNRENREKILKDVMMELRSRDIKVE